MITVKLAARDLNRLLAAVQEARVVYAAGRITIQKKLGPLRVELQAYPDVRDGRLRVLLPFDEIRGDGLGGLLGSLAGVAWKWLESTLEQRVQDRLAAKGLPWDLVWIDRASDPEHGTMGTINVSPVLLNQILRDKSPSLALAPRLADLAVEPDGLTLRFALGPPAPERTP